MNITKAIFSVSILPLACLLFVLISTPANALSFYGQFKQGGLVIGQDVPGIEVYLDGTPVKMNNLTWLPLWKDWLNRPHGEIPCRHCDGPVRAPEL